MAAFLFFFFVKAALPYLAAEERASHYQGAVEVQLKLEISLFSNAAPAPCYLPGDDLPMSYFIVGDDEEPVAYQGDLQLHMFPRS